MDFFFSIMCKKLHSNDPLNFPHKYVLSQTLQFFSGRLIIQYNITIYPILIYHVIITRKTTPIKSESCQF